jgi:hypothetical protein
MPLGHVEAGQLGRADALGRQPGIGLGDRATGLGAPAGRERDTGVEDSRPRAHVAQSHERGGLLQRQLCSIRR